jgi:hypothetical protein
MFDYRSLFNFKSVFVAAASTAALLIGPHTARAADFTFAASAPSPFAPNCNGAPQAGNLFTNSEVEPYVAINPRFPLNLIGVWQQDRWSNGGSQGLGTGVSFDGGVTWRQRYVPFSRCAGGNAGNNGNYERGSDPWITFSPNGVAHQMALTLNNAAADQATALLASRSTDGGLTWSTPITLIRNGPEFFNDKNTMTADPTDSRYVYGIWDRLDNTVGGGPTIFVRTTNGGVSWEPARVIYDLGPNGQTIGNLITVLPNGKLVNLFTQIDYVAGSASLQVIISSDKGTNWSQPFKIADLFSVGTFDPETGAPVRDGGILAQITSDRRGHLHAVWQDSRFSGGAYDGIAYARSTDGGSTWSAPVQVNREPAVPAFTPAVHVRHDGTIGVSYYDFRSNTADATTLLTEYWLVRSRDTVTWRESRLSAAFDLATAPIARGYFLGDYQGLNSIGPIFTPFFARTTGDPNNRNDIFSQLALSFGAASSVSREDAMRKDAEEEAKLPAAQARTAAPMAMTPALQEKLNKRIEEMKQRREAEWAVTMPKKASSQ